MEQRLNEKNVMVRHEWLDGRFKPCRLLMIRFLCFDFDEWLYDLFANCEIYLMRYFSHAPQALF